MPLEILRKDILTKIKRKNLGNLLLTKAIDKLIKDLEGARWENKTDVIKDRTDADCVHSDGFYFFDIKVHRTMILLEFPSVNIENGEATILWAGTHEEYDKIFKGNKITIEKWLRDQGLIK